MFDIVGLEGAELVSRGGFGEVYRAHQPQFDRVVAVKVLFNPLLDERARRQFNRECAAAGRLTGHPNIVTVFDSGFLADGRAFLVMAWMPGGSLADRLASAGPLSASEVMRIGVKLSGALQTAHDAGVLHRDVKPANVLMSDFGEPALADFGIASLVSGGGATTRMDAMSLEHAPPEVLEENTASPFGDQYSLASSLYELLSGRPPFEVRPGEAILARLTRVLGDPVPRLDRDLPSGLSDVLDRAMSKSPGDRFGSVADLGDALRELQRSTEDGRTEMVLRAAVPAADPINTIPDPFSTSGTTPRVRHFEAAPELAPSRPPARQMAPSYVIDSADSTPRSGLGSSTTVARDRAAAPEGESDHTVGPSTRSTASRIALGGAAGVAIVAMVLILAALLRSKPTEPPETTSPPGTTSTVDLDLQTVAPTVANVEDFGQTVEVSWTDRSGGRVPHIVKHSPDDPDRSVSPLLRLGTTSYEITGLDPDTGYCITVGAMVGAGTVAWSDPECIRGAVATSTTTTPTP